jgi:UDP-N-acetylmuramate-alanine ligase
MPLADPDLAAMVWRSRTARRFVVCLGAGNITQWAHALPASAAPRKCAPRWGGAAA